MKISARNVFAGKVDMLTNGAVNTEVLLTLPGGETIVSVITKASAESLGLAQGKAAYAIIKASDVMIGKGLDAAKLSARNILTGEVTKLQEGAVYSEVEVRLPGGTSIVGSITKESVKALGLINGDKVSAVVKASHVLIGV
jgi:molybdate transport system regulatory protein